MPLIPQQNVITLFVPATAEGGVGAAVRAALEAYPPVRIVSIAVNLEQTLPKLNGTVGITGFHVTAVIEVVAS